MGPATSRTPDHPVDHPATGATTHPTAPPRRPDIEALRLLSCWAIVSFHVRPAGGAVAYGGLVAFIVLSVWLGGSGRPLPSGWAGWRALAGRAQQRGLRLLRPWALWALAYGALNLARGGDFLLVERSLPAAVLAGPSIHLWYLPFMWGCLLGLDGLRLLLSPRLLALGAGLAGVAVVAAVPWWRPASLQAHLYPWLQWADAAAPVLVGVFLAGARALPRAQVLGVAAALAAAVAWVCPHEPYGWALLGGLASTGLLATGWTARWLRWDLTPLSNLTFGIYLAHIGVWVLLLDHGWAPPALLPEAIVLIAGLLVATLRRLAPRAAPWWS